MLGKVLEETQKEHSYYYSTGLNSVPEVECQMKLRLWNESDPSLNVELITNELGVGWQTSPP